MYTIGYNTVGETVRRLGLDWIAQAQVPKVSNMGLISEGSTDIKPVLGLWKIWIFDYTHTQTLANFIIKCTHIVIMLFPIYILWSELMQIGAENWA